ncbi:MAG TPA: TadE family protein [Lacipirellulaceae bacterium]|jgi:Flp pilus assembly protein TadG|nr:TadE family protein [Lacipirellulaceae bacterium]
MMIHRVSRRRNSKACIRRGVAAVEFAFVAPLLVALAVGVIKMGRAFEMQNLLNVAAREGARFASMDRTGMVATGQTANQKLINDVKNYLATEDIPKSAITVAVKDHVNPTADFNLDDPANDLKLFDVKVSVKFSAVSLEPTPANNDFSLNGGVTFRNGRATISQ